MEKTDSEKPQEEEPPVLNQSNNPLYCSYVDGKFTYKDPNTGVQHVWNEGEKKWVVKEPLVDVDSNKVEEREHDVGAGGGSSSGGEVMSPGTSQVQFDGENYTYTDQDGTVFLWDSGKGAWFPKDAPSTPTHSPLRLPPSPPDLSSCSGGASTSQTIGFFNPNYSTQLTSPTTNVTTVDSNQSRRFYYASLSPTSMGVNENPGLFLSPDDQVNNNDQAPDNVDDSVLPPGWEKHDDSNGPYYWHVKSGTIQRERPTLNSPVSSLVTQITNNPALMIPGGMDGGISGFVRRSNTVSGISASGGGGQQSTNEKRRSWVNYLESDNEAQVREQQQFQRRMSEYRDNRDVVCVPAYEFDKNALKFAAVSLGCLSISEEDLTPERSSRAVSKVIAELTSGGGGGKEPGNRGSMDLASRIWTHAEAGATTTQQMYLELTDSHLRVKVNRMDGSSNQATPITVLEQPIHSIRVWGVGREDPRDFAFVAREKQTRQFLCHVFRLDMYARPLASSLRDACKKIMIERNARSGGGSKRPTSLVLGGKKGGGGSGGKSEDKGGSVVSGVGGLLFPTPMDEPRKMIKAFYLGSKSVNRPTGIEVLNNAIEGMKAYGVEKIPVLVSVAPSVIGITSTSESPPKVQIEVRVRFLSFMGIGSDVRTCGIIIHTARDDFEAHCFYQTPSTGALCKAIEAACVLRYQKCLDAHHPVDGGDGVGKGTRSNSVADIGSNGSSIPTSPKSAAVLASATASNLASALKTVFSSFGKTKSDEKL